MLEHLFGSRTRVKLISLFLSQSDEAIFVREVTRRIETQINAVRRELANLVKFGIIIETEEADFEPASKRPGLKRKYYRLNTSFPLLPEVRSLITKAQLLVEDRVDHILAASDGVRYAALMGVFMGIVGAPVDLFIVGSIDATSLGRVIASMEKSIGKEINYTVMPLSDYEYRKQMADKFLSSILEAPKHVVVDALGDQRPR